MRVITAGQRTDEWMAARAGRITASRCGDIMARTRNGASASRANMIVQLAVERITGACIETYQNEAMRRGTELEGDARIAYEVRRGVLVEEIGLALHDELPFIAASVDGLVGDDGLFEAKCPSAMAKHLDALRSGAHAVEYRWQLQHQLWVTGRSWVDAVSFDPRWPEHLQLAITRVERDDSAIAELEAACIEADIEVDMIVAELKA